MSADGRGAPLVRERLAGPDGGLSYWRSGSGSPLVLLHSLALSGAMWRAVAPELAGAGHEVIALDLRGHGDSGWSGRDFTVADLAADVVALLDHLGLERANLLGLSMGGSVALSFAGLFPSRVERLVLADTTAWYGEGAPAAWAERADAAASRARHAQVAFQLDRWFSEGLLRRDPATVSLVTGIFLATRPSVHAAACRALGAMDSRPLLSFITAPTLVFTGAEDHATPPEMGEALAAGIAGARFLLAPARHFALLESRALRDVVAAHLAGEDDPESELDLAEACCAAWSGAA